MIVKIFKRNEKTGKIVVNKKTDKDYILLDYTNNTYKFLDELDPKISIHIFNRVFKGKKQIAKGYKTKFKLKEFVIHAYYTYYLFTRDGKFYCSNEISEIFKKMNEIFKIKVNVKKLKKIFEKTEDKSTTYRAYTSYFFATRMKTSEFCKIFEISEPILRKILKRVKILDYKCKICNTYLVYAYRKSVKDKICYKCPKCKQKYSVSDEKCYFELE